MESTGVYWIPVYEVLEQRGFEVVLVNARDAKHVPGRKTDVSDAQWLQRLHEYGLLRGGFRPQGEIAALRAYLRQRERLLDYAASHIQHVQKAPTQRGNCRGKHLFALAQALELNDAYQAKVADCDVRIETALTRLREAAAKPVGQLPPPRHTTRQPNAVAFDVRATLHAIVGVDLTQIHGLGPYLALKLVGECGTNLTAWPNAKCE